MTNQELQNMFMETMLNNTNIFDIYLELNSKQKEYQSTAFYKATKLPLIEAFRIYFNSIGQIDYLLSAFKNFDIDNMPEIQAHITKALSFDSIMDTMSPSNKELFTALLPYIR